MSKERLSKLQKWILVECYKNNGGLLRESIIRLYFKEEKTASREVTVSRSTWSLVIGGYVQGFAPRKVSDVAMIYGMMGKSIENFSKDYADCMEKPNEKVVFPVMGGETKIKLILLTDKGKEKAKQLLNVKF